MYSEIAFGVAGAIATLGLAATGSALGTGRAAAAAVGAWKKCYAQNKPAPFILLSYVGAPITQTLYGMILMRSMISIAKTNPVEGAGFAMLIIGIFAGLALGTSAYLQGIACAGAADAQAETGKGLSNNLSAIGIVETTAIFAMVFTYISVSSLEAPKTAAIDEPAPAPIAQAADVAD